MNIGGIMQLIQCGICNEDFASKKHHPMMMPCGHTYCLLCLQILQESGELKCPSCNQVHENTSVHKLPLNFMVLHISEGLHQQQEVVVCFTHSEDKRYWCKSCQSLVCGLCIFQSHHGSDHEVIKISELIRERQVSCTKEVDGALVIINSIHNLATRLITENIIDILHLYKILQGVKNLRLEAEHFHESIANCKQISSFVSLGKDLKDTLKKASHLSDFLEKCQRRQKSRVPKNDHGTSVEENVSESTGKLENQLKAASCKLDCLGIAARSDDNCNALMTWEGNRLHVFSFTKETVPTDITVKWNWLSHMVPREKPELFLELEADDKYFGIIYITLRGHLRRAEHFMALCIGSLGSTYSGSYLSGLRLTGNAKFIVGGSYINPDGSTGTKGLLEDLEWGKKYERPQKRGLVVAYDNGKPDIDALFAIIIDTKETKKCMCPFGEVTSGLDVLTEVSRYETLDRVRIARCGVILALSENETSETDEVA